VLSVTTSGMGNGFPCGRGGQHGRRGSFAGGHCASIPQTPPRYPPRKGDVHLSNISDSATLLPCPGCGSPRAFNRACARCGYEVEPAIAADGLSPPPEVQFPGYVVVRPVGAGGMGEVFLAHPEGFPNDPRALKTPHRELVVGSPVVAERFRREAFAIQRIRSPHVVRVLDIGQTTDGRPFLAMEWLDGRSLEEALQDPASPYGDPFRPEVPDLASALARDLAEALEALHAQGVVHRDVKAGNVMLCPAASGGTRPVLIDFGIARLEDLAASGATAGMALGTAENMAPEVARGEEADARTDVYLLTQLLYRVLSGVRRSTGQAKRMSRINPALPATLDDVIEDGLADDPEDRPQTPTALAERVQAALAAAPIADSAPIHEARPVPVRAPRPDPSPRSVEDAAPPPNPAPVTPDRPKPAGRRLGLLLAIALGVGVALAAAFLRDPAPAPATHRQEAAVSRPVASVFPASGDSGPLVVATGNHFPPYFDFKGHEPRGFDVDFGNLLASRLGKPSARFVPGTGARERATGGQADLAIAAISITADRAKETLFSQPYLSSRLVAVQRAGRRLGEDTLGGARCSVHSGHKLYRDLLETRSCAFVFGTSHQDAMNMVQTGAADWTVVDESQLARLPEGVASTGVVLGLDFLAVGMQLGNIGLKARVDAAIGELIQDGSIDALIQKHGLAARLP
jgi:serine/threonine protein kinase/ABC-type amino acid transport substrate-binding protein